MSRRLRHILLFILLTPLILFFLGAVALYIPWVQDVAIRHVTEKIRESFEMEVHIGRLRLGFPAELSVHNLHIIPEEADTLLSVSRLELALSLRPLFSGEVTLPRASIEGLRFRQQDSLGLTQTQVVISRGGLEALHIDLQGKRVSFGLLQTQGGRIFYSSTDTISSPSTPLDWRIHAEEIRLSDTELQVRLPMDSLYLASEVDLLHLRSGDLDVKTNELSLTSGVLSASRLSYASDEQPPVTQYLDPSHLVLSDISLELQDLHSLGRELRFSVKKGKAQERSGFALTQLQGAYRMDSLGMSLSNLALRSDYSAIYGEFELPWSIFEREHKGSFYTILDGAVGAEDVRLLSGRNLLEIGEADRGDVQSKQTSLTGPIDFALHTRGSADSLWIEQGQLLWGGVLDLSVSGSLTNVDRPAHRGGSLSLEGGLQVGASTLLALVSPELARQYSLPEGLTFKGKLGFGGGLDHLQMKLAESNGMLELSGSYNELTEAYNFKANSRGFNLARYMRQTTLGELTAEAEFSGRGLDWRSKHTRSSAKIRLHNLAYAGRQLTDVTLDGSLKAGAMALAINSFNDGLNLAVQLDGLLTPSGVYSSIVLDTEDLDLERWGLRDLPFKLKGQLSGELRTDYKQTHSLATTVRDMKLSLAGREILPKEVQLQAQTTPTTSALRLSSGDLLMDTRIGAGADSLGRLFPRLSTFWQQIQKQVVDTAAISLRLEDVFTELPEVSLSFTMGTDNALRPYLAEERLSIGSLSARLDLSNEGELRGQVTAQNIRQDTLRISTVSLGVNTLRVPRRGVELSPENPYQVINDTDSLVLLDLSYAITRERYRSQEGYTVSGNVRSNLQEARGQLAWVDMAGNLRHKIALEASWSGPHYALRLSDPSLLVSYRSLDVNPDNTIRIDKRTLGIDGDLRLTGPSGELLSLQSTYDVHSKHQDVLLQVQRLNLEDYRMPSLPDLGGIVFADVRYGRTGNWTDQPTITGDLSVQKLRYEDKELGHFATALFYEPRTDRSHYISAEMSYQGNEAFSLDAIYYPERRGDALSGSLALKALPLEVANPFLHRYGLNLGGRTSGNLVLSGSLVSPRLEGNIRSVEAHVHLEQYATKLELDSIPLRLDREALHFDHYALRSSKDNRNPLYVDGRINLSGSQAMTADLRLRASDMTLLNQSRPRTEREDVYGRLIASTDMTLRGRLDALKVRGRIDIQGGSNFVYVLREGGLDVGERGQELLSFVDFADTLFVRESVQESKLGGLDVNLALHIDPSVRFGVDLTADGTDYMRVQGGGDMQFSYPPYGEMRLIGRYNMSGGGQLHYTIPIVGGKLFEISPTGYLRFGGNLYNPYINFKATQQVKATVGSASKKTSFLVGLEVKDQIEDIKLGFELSAPEDLTVQNTLSTMTAEERGKQAIGLMATGMFLAGRTGGKLKFDSALTSFLQAQINKAAGTLLRDTDINIGMETHDGSSGGVYTDYIYSFSRRFYNDRIRVVVGGKIQSGNVPSSKEQTLIDNVALEYQLDRAGEQYLRIYHKRITDNVLEGEHTETGLGYLIKRKLSRPSDLFRFHRPESNLPVSNESTPWDAVPMVLPADTTSNTIKNEEDR